MQIRLHSVYQVIHKLETLWLENMVKTFGDFLYVTASTVLAMHIVCASCNASITLGVMMMPLVTPYFTDEVPPLSSVSDHLLDLFQV